MRCPKCGRRMIYLPPSDGYRGLYSCYCGVIIGEESERNEYGGWYD